MDKRRIGLFLSFCLLIPHGAQSTGRSLQQVEYEDCDSDCLPKECTKIAYLFKGDNLVGPEPFMASLRDSDGKHLCGGTLIAPNVVLTAAHCITNGDGPLLKPKVHVGRFSNNVCDYIDFEVFRTVRSVAHPQFSSTPSAGFDNDIALLVLDSSSSRRPIRLASSDSCFDSKGGCRVRLVGWGDNTSEEGKALDFLQEEFTTSVSRGTCEAQLQTLTITRSMICAGETQDRGYICLSESGGPMILESGEQVGIVSFGTRCTRPGNPGVYSSVPHFLGWIQDELDRISGSFCGDCDCARFGVSDGINTGRFGCATHLAHVGDSGRFCMVRGGTRCSNATESKAFPIAAWKDC